MEPFTYNGIPARVVFGSGTLALLPDELARIGCASALVLSTPRQIAQAEMVRDLLNDSAVAIFGNATMHSPVTVTEQALVAIAGLDVDCIIAIGGGSAIGLGKAIAFRTDLPQIVIPTTYAGSEMTPILGQTDDGVKTTLRSPKVQPETVIYDVGLTMSLPRGMTGASGMNAIAHAVEAMYAEDSNPVISLMAEEGIRALGGALPRLMQALDDRAARSDALYGAWLCGTALGSTSMALHHKLCHVLGGAFNLPHAETHAIVLPYAVAYNASAAPQAMTRVAAALEAEDAVQGLFALAGALDVPRGLRDIGMPEAGIDRAADLAVKTPYANPRPIKRAAIRNLIARAWAGEPPPVGAGHK